MLFKVGSSDANTNGEVTKWQQWFNKKYKAYAPVVDGYFGYADRDAVSELQRRLGIPVTGRFDDLTAQRSGYKTIPAPSHRPIWFYSAPGSGADWWVGPSFETGKWVQETFNINHQPVGFPKGGYLGFLGGDPGLSYLEVIEAEKQELARLIRACPDLHDPNVEFWFSGYSQSADGMIRAVHQLFGDGGEFAHLRSRINGVITFGNPARQRGPVKGGGGNPPGWGIARDIYPQWLNDVTYDVTTNGDFYACVPDNDEIRPAFYDIIIQSETSLPFFVHVLKVAVPVIIGFTPVLNLFGPLGTSAVALMAGLNNFVPLLTGLMGQAGTAGDEEVDRKLIEMLSITGIIKNIPGLITLVGSLPGLQAHNEYHLPKPEFGGRTGIQCACDIVKDFRR